MNIGSFAHYHFRRAVGSHDGDRGFSLVEVLVAMGLLAGVLITTAGLFIVGGKQVKSGRTSSEALAVGKEIHEDMVGWGYGQLWGMFGYDGQATTYTVDTRTCGACAAWQATLATKLGPSAFANIRLDSVGTVAGAPTNFADGSGGVLAKAVRISVTVNWTEVPGRARSVTLGTTRN
jgi:prepilin-type N-terminal cleavage/methylation domain-containing protein